jgi:NADPH:quinone reductase-like Zn-dependent oxidoreductase
MKAIVYEQCGSPDVLRCEEIAKPAVGDSQVLIRVRAASVNPLEVGQVKGIPYLARVIFGLRKPEKGQPAQLGVDVSGEVDAVGSKVTRFKVGDAVFGLSINDPRASGAKAWVHDRGSFAEYVCAPEEMLELKPENITFEQAASVGVAGLTGLQGLRDYGHIQAGQKVLVNGAAGGVGTFAVQIAKAFGAEVTGVCSSRNLALVRAIGADHVLDYTQQDFARLGKKYDLILDCVSNHSLSECRRALAPKGICVMAGDLTGRGAGGILWRLFASLVLSRLSSQKFVTFLAKPRQDDLATLRDLLRAGKITPVVDKCYSLTQVPDALRLLEQKHVRGKLVISVG